MIEPVKGADDNGGKDKDLAVGNYLRIVDKGGNDGIPGKETDYGEDAAQAHRENGGAANDSVHTL